MNKTKNKLNTIQELVIRKKIIFVLILIVFVLFVALFSPKISINQKSSGKEEALQLMSPKISSLPNYKSERTNWKSMLDKESDPKVVYSRFVNENRKRKPDMQHAWSHFFGDLLYEKFGDKAISVCDSSFAFGCFHGVAIRSILENGIKEITLLDRACATTDNPVDTIPCKHGIGHGLMEYFDHKISKLTDALNLCTTQYKETGTERFLGCYSGVFMEFNNVKSISIPKSEKDLYSPCTIVPEQYQDICYHRNTEWWGNIYKNDYEKLGNLCIKISDEKNRRACFVGIGHLVLPAGNLKPNQIVELCRTVKDREGQSTCILAAADLFFMQTKSIEQTNIICQGLRNGEKNKCFR